MTPNPPWTGQAFLEEDDNWKNERKDGAPWELPEPEVNPEEMWPVPREGTS
jgi:hypothetical protein